MRGLIAGPLASTEKIDATPKAWPKDVAFFMPETHEK